MAREVRREPRAWPVLVVSLPVVAFGMWLAVWAYHPDSRISEYWAVLPAMVVALTAADRGPATRSVSPPPRDSTRSPERAGRTRRDGRTGPAGQVGRTSRPGRTGRPGRTRRGWRWWRGPRAPRLWGLATILVVIAVSAGVLSGLGAAQSLRIALVNLAAALLTLAVYRFGATGDGWALNTPAALLRLTAAVLVGSAVVVLLGGYPGSPVWPNDPVALVRWYIRIVAHDQIGLMVFLVLYYWPHRAVSRTASWPVVVAVFVGGLLTVYAPFERPDLPISWLCVVPALAAGMTLRPPAAALYALVVSLFSGLGVFIEGEVFDYEGLVPPAVLIDGMLGFSALLTILVAVFRDQRARMLLELERRRTAAHAQTRLLRAMVDSMSEGLVLADPGVSLHLSNPAAGRLLGRPVPADLPESWTQYFGVSTPTGDRALTDADVPLPSPERPQARVGDYGVPGPDGGIRVLSSSTQLVPSRFGPLVLLLFHDVTAEYARYRELRAFAGTVAHDLKGPLAAVAGWLEAADDELAAGDPVSGRRALVRARETSGRMRGLIDEYLSFTVARDGMLRMSSVPLETVAREVVADFAGDGPRAPRIELDVHHRVRGDRGLVRQLLANLVGNAVKYARPGEPARIALRSTAGEPGWVRLEIADAGVGLQPGDEEKIFAAFSRSSKDADAYAGIGLGLALCHSIVSRHGGRISAGGNADGGATFTVVLPAG